VNRPRGLPVIVLAFLALGAGSAGAQNKTADNSAVPVLQTAKPSVTIASADQETIPGPLRSFLRMAAISQKATPDEVLSLLARNITIRGFSSASGSSGKPTEYLLLVRRYLEEARDLRALAGPQEVIRIPDCTSAGPLLQILGYKLREPCGPTTSLATSEPARAFLTIDSGFPLVDLEEALRNNKPFVYPYASSKVPILFRPADWLPNARATQPGDVLQLLLTDRSAARLYSALGKMDPQAAVELKNAHGLAKLYPLAPVLDFYGEHLVAKAGKAVVPGGPAAEASWESLAGGKTSEPAEFFTKLLAKDNGWLAAYFDAIASASPSQQSYFADRRHLERCYSAFRDPGTSISPARPTFRPDTYTFLLIDRLQFDSNGLPHVPGGLAAWHDILANKSNARFLGNLGKKAGGNLDSPEQLLEAMFSLSRAEDRSGPVAFYLTANEIDRRRPRDLQLSSATVQLLAAKFRRFGDQYRAFSEFPLSDSSIASYLTIATAIDQSGNSALRENAVGLFQANTGLWQILARQGEIPADRLDASWHRMIGPFAKMSSAVELFDAAQLSFENLYADATAGSPLSQQNVVMALAGPETANAQEQAARQKFANRINVVLTDQQLVSLDTLLDLGRGLNRMAQNPASADTPRLLDEVAEVHEFEMPKPIFTEGEKSEWASGHIDNAHIALQARTDLMKVLKSQSSPDAIAQARGELAPFLRDTLVGLNYAYYEPPGDQILHNNPLFVRSHDFSSGMSLGGGQSWLIPSLFGLGETAGGGGHLAGSLADLPYVLAKADQDFVVPQNVQELVWDEMVPSLLTTATLSRWWNVSPRELHAAALYQEAGEELVGASAKDENLRGQLLDILSPRTEPRRLADIGALLRNDQADDALAEIAPAETAYLAEEYRRKFPGVTNHWGHAGSELESLSICCAADMSWEKIAQDFGVPHPILAQTYSKELLNGPPIPAFMGYPSRLLAESWESTNLYWARLADEAGDSPGALNDLAPKLTLLMSEKLAATDIEDWPAVVRAMRETGEEFRHPQTAEKQNSGETSAP
jgi:hypothetical protein